MQEARQREPMKVVAALGVVRHLQAERPPEMGVVKIGPV